MDKKPIEELKQEDLSVFDENYDNLTINNQNTSNLNLDSYDNGTIQINTSTNQNDSAGKYSTEAQIDEKPEIEEVNEILNYVENISELYIKNPSIETFNELLNSKNLNNYNSEEINNIFNELISFDDPLLQATRDFYRSMDNSDIYFHINNTLTNLESYLEENIQDDNEVIKQYVESTIDNNINNENNTNEDISAFDENPNNNDESYIKKLIESLRKKLYDMASKTTYKDVKDILMKLIFKFITAVVFWKIIIDYADSAVKEHEHGIDKNTINKIKDDHIKINTDYYESTFKNNKIEDYIRKQNIYQRFLFYRINYGKKLNSITSMLISTQTPQTPIIGRNSIDKAWIWIEKLIKILKHTKK